MLQLAAGELQIWEFVLTISSFGHARKTRFAFVKDEKRKFLKETFSFDKEAAHLAGSHKSTIFYSAKYAEENTT